MVPPLPPTAEPGAPTSSSSSAPDGTSAKTQVSELKDLLVAYVKQETIDPLRNLLRFVVWGTVGAVLLSVGCVCLILAIVRALQVETRPHLAGNLTWVPYTGGILFAILVAALAVSRIAARGKRGRA